MIKETQRKDSFNIVLNAIKMKSVVIIQGLRRIGKTLVMNSVGRDSSFNDHEKIEFNIGQFGQDDNKEALRIMDHIKSNSNKKFLLLVDEFQDLVDWEKFFKTLHSFGNVKVIATGSVSANIDISNNTEGGRFDYIQMQTLSFNEFKKMYSGAGLSDEEYFDRFATFGSYPEQEFNEDIISYKKQVSENIFEKIKNVTLLKRAQIDDPQKVNNVLLYLIENVGQSSNANAIANKLGIDIRTVEKILYFLKMTFIIHEVANSKQSKGRAAQANKKYYLTDHTFFLFIKQNQYSELTSPFQDFIFENIIINEVKKKFSRYEVETRFEIDKELKIDYDLVTEKSGVKKYFEIKNSKSCDSLSKDQKKVAKGKNVIYLGETKKENEIQFINYLEFIKEVEIWL